MHGIPRQYIWTFAVGYTENNSNHFVSPCDGDSKPVPPYVGDNYLNFCESGYIYPGYSDPPSLYTFHPDDVTCMMNNSIVIIIYSC